MFLNNARTRSGERRTNFLTEASREKEEERSFFFVLLAEKTKTMNSDIPRAFFRLPFSFLSFFLRISFSTNGLLTTTAFFWTFKTLLFSNKRDDRDIAEKTRFTEAEERKEARKKKRGRRRRRRRRQRNFYDFYYDFYDENAWFLSVLFFF